MDIYVTDLETADSIRFPMLPEKITVQTGVIFQSYTIMAVGNIKLLAGEELTGFSWSGILPGEARKNDPYITEWKDPKEIQSLWSMFRAKKKKLWLLITETPINHHVYIGGYTVDYKHGYGDYYYTISFTQAKDLKIGVSTGSSATGSTAMSSPKANALRPEPPVAKTHTVVKGDSLWGIAQKLMGDGSKYPELYEANKDAIDARNKGTGNTQYTIYPGQVFTIPS